MDNVAQNGILEVGRKTQTRKTQADYSYRKSLEILRKTMIPRHSGNALHRFILRELSENQYKTSSSEHGANDCS